MTTPIVQPEIDHGATLRAWLELVRLPNLATAWGDILMGFLVTHASFETWPVLLLLMLASTGFYLAGMVFNDVFDVEIDRRERPQRPIPSGRISLAAARCGAIALLIVGLAASMTVSVLIGTAQPALIGSLLAIAVLLYDGVLKQTPIAPLVMGSCRFLNVLLGMSASAAPWHPMLLLIAAGLGIYIAGVTWFARTEARASNRGLLLFGIATMAIGLALLAWFPSWHDAQVPQVSSPNYTTPDRWWLTMGMLGALIGWRAIWGVIEPVPARVQMAVKQAILSLIVLDASIAFVFRGLEPALVILLLLIPAMWLGRWIYST